MSELAAVAVTPNKKETELERAERLKNLAEGTLADTRLVLQQTVETNLEDESKGKQMNPVTAKVFGIMSPEESHLTQYEVTRPTRNHNRFLCFAY